MKNKFLETVERYSMFSRGDSVVVGLSGGADSMCLVSLLNEVKNELGISLMAVHVNHCIRGEEADRDEMFVRSFCKKNNIPLKVFRENIPEIAKITGESTELCARRIRYEAFDKCSADKIATAHSASDRIETLLFNLSRGSALSGLCSIPAVRDNIVRPLISFTRSEIEDYCRENSIDYVTDSTNLTDEYTRNKIRLNVIPQMTAVNSSFEKNVSRCIELLNEENAYIEGIAQKILKDCVADEGRLSVGGLIGEDACIIRRVIISFLERNSVYEYEFSHIRLICENVGRKFALYLPGDKRIISDEKYLTLENKATEEAVPELQCYSFSKNENISFSKKDKAFEVFFSDTAVSGRQYFCVDADKIGEKLIFRSRNPGDEIKPFNRGCRKTLRKLFSEMKIPVNLREYKYVLADENGVIFVEDVGIDARCSCNNKTKKYLIIKMEDFENE